jgi:CheY-like chemotaxis protein
VIDDDQPTLHGMGGLLRSWGCRVVTGVSDSAALTNLAAHDETPDLIISDYRLPDGKTGVDVIKALRAQYRAQIPAFLISGDTNPEPLHEARSNGYQLLHKPLDPMTLRAMLNRMVRRDEVSRVFQ